MVSLRNVLLFIAASVSALPGLDLSKNHFWLPAKRSDSRSPCPMLNTMANHGFLPRDGRNLTVADIGASLKKGINFNQGDAKDAAQGFYTRLNNATHLDLEDLNAHNITDHDASLTRQDFHGPGTDSLHVDYIRLAQLIADAGKDADLTPLSLAKSRIRVEEIQPISPDFVGQTLGEAGFILQTMSAGELPQGLDADYSQIKAPKARVAAWMALERLPVEFGWKKPKSEFTTAQTGGLAQEIGKQKAGLLA